MVVHRRDGRIRDYATFGMAPVQAPARRSKLAAEIQRAVIQVALARMNRDKRLG